METRLTIKNFRVFDENGVTIDLKPITILTGTNSSGKSTVVKAALQLNSFLSQIKEDLDNGNNIHLDKYKLDFSTFPNNLLGSFDKVIHDGSSTRKVTFEYTVYSLLLSKDVTVQLVFSANKNDELNNAYLDSILIRIVDDVIYSSSIESGSYCNLNVIKEDCIDFLWIEDLIYQYRENEDKYIENESEYESEKNRIKDYLNNCNKTRTKDIIQYIRTGPKRESSLITDSGSSCAVVANTKKSGSFFFIPILDKLKQVSKLDFRSFIETNYLKYADEAFSIASNRIIDDFISSNHNNFYEYFLSFEKRHFEHIKCDYIKNSLTESKSLHLLGIDELAFPVHGLIAFSSFNNLRTIEENGDILSVNDENKHSFMSKIINIYDHRPTTFDLLYEVLIEWNRLDCIDKGMKVSTDKDTLYNDFRGYNKFCSYKALTRFVYFLTIEVISPKWCDRMSYVSSSRAEVVRLYTLNNQDDFSKLLRNYFETKRLFLDSSKRRRYRMPKYKVNSFLNRWIKKFEIGNSISLYAGNDGLGVQIKLHKTKSNKGRLLADEGYGITQLVSILLQIETAILSAKGVSVNRFFGLKSLDQFDEDKFYYEVNTVAIEEPEIHLHPKYQSLLADMFLEAYEKYNIHFIIETHSEYLIRKAQVFVARRNYKNKEAMNKENPFKVYYVPRGEKPYEMTFNIDGAFQNEFGKGFFDEATNLAFEIL